jgi:ribosomal protein S18 acetylase RimI-like enzyme
VSQPASADTLVRDARPADAADLARIQVGRWRAGYSGLVPDPVLAEITSIDNERRCAGHWASSLNSPPSSRHRVLVAVGVAAEPAGGQRHVAGFASFGPASDPGRWPGTDAELYELCVDPGQAGRGHGSRLLNAAAAAMAEDGFGTALAWVLEQDAAARRFLESAGWAADGARRSLDMGIPVPTLRLHTGLAAPS